MIYKVGVCDDEKSTCIEIERYVQEFFAGTQQGVETYVWNLGVNFKKDVPDKVKLDILFLDIEMPGCDGLDIGRYVREQLKDNDMQIVYVSSKTNYAMQLFKMHPYDFLTKPIKKEQIEKLIQELVFMKESDKRFYTYYVRKNQNTVAVGDIVYFESDKRHIRMKLKNGEYREFVGKLKDEILKLPDYFAEIGQSYIINLRHMSECNSERVIMEDGAELNISRAYKNIFSDKLMEYNEYGGISHD